MVLWERGQIRARSLKFKTYILYVVEFKSLSLFCDLKQQFKQSLCQSI